MTTAVRERNVYLTSTEDTQSSLTKGTTLSSKPSKTQTPASASEVRAWARENVASLPEGTNLDSIFGKDNSGVVRGRLNPVISAAFTEATGRPYSEKSVAEKRMVTLPLTKPNAKGARLKRPEAFPLSEVRALAGAPAKGRLSSKHIATAVERVQEQRGW